MAPASRGGARCRSSAAKWPGTLCATAVLASLARPACSLLPAGGDKDIQTDNTSALRPRTLWPLMAKQLGSLHTMHKVNLGAYPMAQCLDGSPGTFYIAPAKKKANALKWTIHFPSSGVCSMSAPRGQTGDCVLMEHCADRRSGPRGSSATYPMMTPVLESEQMTIPLTRDWNRVVVVSCDGGMFSGRLEKPVTVDGKMLYFRGGYITDAIIDTLLHKFSLDQATDVVLSGTGAGGTAVSLQADQWRKALPESVFLAVISDTGISGNALTSRAQDENPVAALHRNNYHDMNVSDSLHRECVAERAAAGADASDCFFGDMAARFSRTPMFFKQSATEIGEVHCVNKDTQTASDADLMTSYASQLRHSVQSVARDKPQHGFYIDNCLHQEGKWFASRINGMSATEAFNTWFASRQKAYHTKEKFNQTALWEQTQPCKLNAEVQANEVVAPQQSAAAPLPRHLLVIGSLGIGHALRQLRS